MRQIGAIISVLILWLSTTGFSVNKHYCQGELVGTSLFTTSSCTCGDEEMPMDCCTSETDYFQLDDVFPPAIQAAAFESVIAIPVYPTFNKQSTVFNISQSQYKLYKPPAWHVDILIDIQTFRI
jgi:hypothetical protein